MSLIMHSGDSTDKTKLVDYSSSSEDDDADDYSNDLLDAHKNLNQLNKSIKYVKEEEIIDIPVLKINGSDEDWLNFNLNVTRSLAKPRIKQEIFPPEASDDFEIIPHGSRRGGDILITGDGYRFLFNKSAKNGKSKYWLCSQRKSKCCRARIVQLNENCIVNRNFHTCTPEINTKLEVMLKMKTKQLATQYPEKTARQIYTEAYKEVLPHGAAMKVPRIQNVIRSVNNFKARHVKPLVDKMFKIDHSQLPLDFLQSHIKEENEQMIIVASEEQLSLMQKSMFWLIDCTLKAIDKPFNQLLTFHVFIDLDSSAKLVDVMYVLMTNKRKFCYVTLFNWIVNKFDGTLIIKSIAADFVEPLWLAAKIVFPNVMINGCLYHWRKRIEKKILHFGLINHYKEDIEFKHLVLNILSLPFLPKDYIKSIFDDLVKDKQNESIECFITFIRTHWMSDIFPVENWSVFENITLCDVSLHEWDQKLDIFIERRPNIYSFINFLYENSYKTLQLLESLQNVNIKLSSQEKEQNILFSNIKHVWHLYRKGDISAKMMLKSLIKLMAFMEF